MPTGGSSWWRCKWTHAWCCLRAARPQLQIKLTPREAGAYTAIDKRILCSKRVQAGGNTWFGGPGPGRRWLLHRLPTEAQAEPAWRIQDEVRQAKGIGGGTPSVGIEAKGLAVNDPKFAHTAGNLVCKTNSRDGFARFGLNPGAMRELADKSSDPQKPTQPHCGLVCG